MVVIEGQKDVDRLVDEVAFDVPGTIHTPPPPPLQPLAPSGRVLDEG